MAYLLLLALVFTLGFIFLGLAPKKSKQYSAGISFGVGLGFLALGYISQLVLGSHLDPDFARLFYWSREMMALAWFGHGLLLLFFGDRMQARWLTYGLVLASVVSLILVGVTQVTKAEDWFRPAVPVFSQISDLLATNRPTRWGAWILNAYGALALVAATVYFLISRKKKTLADYAALLLPLAALAYLAPIIWLPAVSNPAFYIVESIVPILLYFGFSATLVVLPAVKKKPRSQ